MRGKQWTDTEIEILKKEYPNKQTIELLPLFDGREITTIYHKAYSLGLKKTDEFKKSEKSGYWQKGSNMGVRFQFKKGNTPPNKGKKMTDYVSAEMIEKIKSSQWKRGNKPHNTYEKKGTIVVRSDKSKRDYQYIKLSDSNWQLLHRYKWEKKFGTIPKGMIVAFKDKNSMNCRITNLELITMAENLERNRSNYLQYPTELKSVIILKNKINKKLKTIKTKKDE